MGPGQIADAIERERRISRKLLESMSAALRRVAVPSQIPGVDLSAERRSHRAYALMAGAAVGLLVGYWLRRRV